MTTLFNPQTNNFQNVVNETRVQSARNGDLDLVYEPTIFVINSSHIPSTEDSKFWTDKYF
jgi:hypothetical protein